MEKAALSTPEGLTILKMLDVHKKYEALGRMTQAIIEATKTNGSIDLEKAFDESNKVTKAFNDQLRVALGVFQETIVGGRRRFIATEAAAKFFNNHTKRTNFAHMLKKCAQCAAGLIEMKAKVSLDEKKGTLVISGPAVAKEFGNDTVMLDEKMIEGLTQKPSYTAIVAIAKDKRGIIGGIEQDRAAQSWLPIKQDASPPRYSQGFVYRILPAVHCLGSASRA